MKIKEYGLFFNLKKNKKVKICYCVLRSKKDILGTYKLMKELGLYPEVHKWFIQEREVKYSKWGKKEVLK